MYLYNQARYRAKQKGIAFTIKRNDLVIPKKCPILGLTLKINEGKRKEDSYSLDRVDTSKGYIKGNVRVISWRANRLKLNMTLKIFKRFILYLEKKV